MSGSPIAGTASIYRPALFPGQLPEGTRSSTSITSLMQMYPDLSCTSTVKVSGPRCLVIDGRVLSRHVIFSFSWQAWGRLDAVHTYAILFVVTGKETTITRQSRSCEEAAVG